MPDPNADPSPVQPESLPPGRIGFAVDQVALVALVFVATLLLLLGATRLVDRGTPGPISSNAGIIPSASPSSSSSPSQAPGPSGSARVETDTPSATPLASPTGDPVLVGAGDIAQCGSDDDEATAALLDGIAGTVFTAGDNAYESGTAEQFRDCYEPSWGRHRARTRPAPGNHDWETAGLAGYFGYFGDAAKGPDGSSWYSYDVGSWHIIVLDSACEKVDGCDPGSPQGAWLAADLAANPAACTLAIFHVPRFSSGEHGDAPAMDAFWRPLYAAGVDVIVNGHDHDYERFAPQDPDGRVDGDRGIRQFVVGTGGAPLREFTRVAPNSELRAIIGHGLLALTLRGDSYEWAFIAAGSDFRDRGTTPCH
jgi:acid phosphatase type 7